MHFQTASELRGGGRLPRVAWRSQFNTELRSVVQPMLRPILPETAYARATLFSIVCWRRDTYLFSNWNQKPNLLSHSNGRAIWTCTYWPMRCAAIKPHLIQVTPCLSCSCNFQLGHSGCDTHAERLVQSCLGAKKHDNSSR